MSARLPALPPGVLRAYVRRYGKYRWALMFSAALSVLQSLSLIPVAWFIKLSFDRILEKAGFQALVLPCLAILLLVVASSVFSLLARHHSLRITKLVVQDIRLELMAKSYELAATFSGTADRSWLHTAIVQDTERVDVGSNAIVAVVLPAFITSAIFLAALAVLAPMLLLATLAVAPLALLSNRILGRRLRELVERFRRAFEKFDENIFAALRRMELTRLRGAEAAEIASQSVFVDELRRTSGRMAWTATAYNVVQTSITSLASVVTLIAGGSAVALGWMSVSGLAAYYFVLAQLGSNVNALWNAAPQVLAGLDSLGNIARVQESLRNTPTGGILQRRVQGSIEFRDVHFSYGDAVVLDGISLMIPAGSRTAIVGPNGSGKSTLACLLLGLYAPRSGSIWIDNIALADLSLDDYRRQIGVVLQDPLVFAGTVFDNIAYGAPAVTAESVQQAARLSGADAFIRSLPQGYETVIGRAGMSLSGGQYQMLALARALLGQPRVLILDEPTNHLDATAVKALFDNLAALEVGPTILLITHDREQFPGIEKVYGLAAGRLSLLEDNSRMRLERQA